MESSESEILFERHIHAPAKKPVAPWVSYILRMSPCTQFFPWIYCHHYRIMLFIDNICILVGGGPQLEVWGFVLLECWKTVLMTTLALLSPQHLEFHH